LTFAGTSLPCESRRINVETGAVPPVWVHLTFTRRFFTPLEVSHLEASAFGGFFLSYLFCKSSILCKAFGKGPGTGERGLVKRDFIFLNVEVLDFEGVVADEVSAFFDIASH
jgi:hypothetical protein